MRYADFTAWVSEHAIMLDAFDGATADIEKLSFLDKHLAGKRAAFLAEMNHFIHEKYDFRLFLLRYLVSRGWRYFGEELSWSDGIRIDRYLATGDLTHLDRVTSYGYRGAWRADRNDRPTGIIKDAWGKSYPEKEFAAEQTRFAKALRNLNENRQPESDRLHFFGFDVDYIPGGGYEDIDELLSPVQNHPCVAEVQKLLARVPYESLDQEITRLERVLALIDANRADLRRLLGDRDYGELRHSVWALCNSFDYIRLAHPATDWAALNKAMAAREQVMHRHVEHILGRLTSADKVVLLGSSMHLAKDDGGIKVPNVGAGAGGNYRVPSIGHFVNHQLVPGQVLSVWMLYDHGRDNQPFPWLPRRLVSVPGSLNAKLASVGSTFLLPTHLSDPRAGMLSTETEVVQMYNQVFRTVMAEQADAIFFVREVSPLRL